MPPYLSLSSISLILSYFINFPTNFLFIQYLLISKFQNNNKNK